jgi:hypothetical protein
MSFIDVPQVPGVPALGSYAPNNISLIFADAISAVLSTGSPSPSWGIYLNGSAVIQPATVNNFSGGISGDVAAALTVLGSLASLLNVSNIQPALASFIEFDFAQDWRIPNYPVEQGAFQSYDKVQLPFDVRVRIAAGGDPSDRQAFLNTVLAMSGSLALFDVVTPELTYTSCNIHHVDWRRTARNGVELISVELWFQQISVSSSATFQNVLSPVNASPQGNGSVLPQTPSAIVQSEFAAGGW